MTRPLWKKKSFWLGLLATALSFYSFLIEPSWLDIRTQNISSHASDRVTIVQISDLHLKRIGWIEKRVIAAVSEIDPGLVLFTGDVVDSDEGLQNLDSFLKQLGGKQKIAVLGNWEYWSGIDREALKKIYAKNGVTLLVNEQSTFSIGGIQLNITGLDDYTAGTPDEPPIQSTSHFRLLLQHSPGYFDRQLPAQKKNDSCYDLCLSGHSHGGQVTLFGLPLWTPQGSGKYINGRYQTEKCPLYVSRGIGTSILPIRLGARPELSVFEIGKPNPPE